MFYLNHNVVGIISSNQAAEQIARHWISSLCALSTWIEIISFHWQLYLRLLTMWQSYLPLGNLWCWDGNLGLMVDINRHSRWRIRVQLHQGVKQVLEQAPSSIFQVSTLADNAEKALPSNTDFWTMIGSVFADLMPSTNYTFYVFGENQLGKGENSHNISTITRGKKNQAVPQCWYINFSTKFGNRSYAYFFNVNYSFCDWGTNRSVLQCQEKALDLSVSQHKLLC